jgi:hypothetical protein
MRLAFVTAAVAAFLAAAGSASAQLVAPPGACPAGNLTVIRTSQLTSPAALDGFKKAMANHAKWYADHGFTADRFAWARVTGYDRKARTRVASPDKIVTFHYASSYVPASRHDAGWDAFVAEYRQSSRMLTETTVCMEN